MSGLLEDLAVARFASGDPSVAFASSPIGVGETRSHCLTLHGPRGEAGLLQDLLMRWP